jgi:hypothetical protein
MHQGWAEEPRPEPPEIHPPCDFTDATLVYAAVRTGAREIWTLDSDFLVYRLPDRTRFQVIPGGKP